MKKIKNCINKELIEGYIKEHNLTKTKFCKMCKISYSTLTRILNDYDFYLIALFRIARVMEVEVYNLFNF